jgi:hypothetical protein
MASGLCVPHQQAAHMAAPTEGQNINKTLAKGEPSTHGAKRTTAHKFPFLDRKTQPLIMCFYQKPLLASKSTREISGLQATLATMLRSTFDF